MYNKDNQLPILRMSLENVARDFHMRIVETHQEIQGFIEANLDNMVTEFVANELPRLTKDIISQACRNAITDRLRSKDIKEAISVTVEAGLEKAVHQALRDTATDEILWSDDKINTARKILKGTKAWKAVASLWRDELDED